MLKYNEPLSRHTSFKIGGPAYCWAQPENKQGILEALSLSRDKNKKFSIVGKGTNVLVRDEGFDGVVISLGRSFKKIQKESEDIISSGAGLETVKMVKDALGLGLGGCEFLTGIPGNVGGAIFMNAGSRIPEDPDKFSEIKDILLDVEILDPESGEIKTLKRKDIDFKYRYSGLHGKIILGARFKLKKAKKEDIQDKIEVFHKKREWLTKIGFPNAGSIFKNPDPCKPAGMLIESCGLKGKRIGSAEISKVHANIIVNLGNAKANDVLSLIDSAKTSVRQKFGIELELELKII